MGRWLLLDCICLLILASCQPGIPPVKGAEGIGDPYYPGLGNGGYKVRKYTIAMTIDPASGDVHATDTIEADASEALSSFDLDFVGLTVDSITINGSPAAYARSGHELVITPPGPLRSGGEFTVSIVYHGSPAPVSSAAIGREGITVGWSPAADAAINVMSEPDGASVWFPNNDHPRDKAAYRFEITVPKPWIVAATGTLVQTVDLGDQTKFIWVMEQPMASYLASINVDKYTLKTLEGPHGIVVRSYFPPGYRESDISRFDKLPEMIGFLEGIYGPYPFKEYGVVIANPENPACKPNGNAVETQTLSVHCSNPAMADERVIIHELAHQWFGDSVSLENWKDIWLKEGMATYVEYMWLARDKDLATLTRVMKAQMIGYYPKTMTGAPPPDDLYRGEVYLGGALVYHALRLKVGEEAFARIIRTYLERYRYGNAGTDEFIALAQEISGQDLKSFFDSWLYSTDLPEMK